MDNEQQSDDRWANLAGRFADDAYASVKGYVRTYVMHHQLLEHLPPAPARILDVGGGAGHQSFPLAEAGYSVTLVDSSETMLDKADARLRFLSREARQRVALLQGDGEQISGLFANSADAVLSHGVLDYVPQSNTTMVAELAKCAKTDGIVSIMTGNQRAMALRPAIEGRWDDVLPAFDADTEIGVLGTRTYARKVEDVEEQLRANGVRPLGWYGVWLFSDLLSFPGVDIDITDREKVAAAELKASRTDPYRQMSRVFHVVGRRQ